MERPTINLVPAFSTFLRQSDRDAIKTAIAVVQVGSDKCSNSGAAWSRATHQYNFLFGCQMAECPPVRPSVHAGRGISIQRSLRNAELNHIVLIRKIRRKAVINTALCVVCFVKR